MSAVVTEPLPSPPGLACETSIEKNSDLNVRLPKRSARVLDSVDECSVITEISMDSYSSYKKMKLELPGLFQKRVVKRHFLIRFHFLLTTVQK